jgi:hypothetical protein
MWPGGPRFFTLGEFTLAAQTIQRAWRASPTYVARLRAEARVNASQLGPQPFGRDSLMGDYDFLNHDHSFWQCTGSEDEPVAVQAKIYFSDECLVRGQEDNVGTTDFRQTSDKSSRLFAEIITSLFGNGAKPLYDFFSHPNARLLKPYFQETIFKLEQRKVVALWDGKSTKLNPTNTTLMAVRECFVKYNYFTASPPSPPSPAPGPPLAHVTPESPINISRHDDIRIQNIMELMVNDLLGGPVTCMAKPMAKPMGLVRLAPRKVAGVTMIDQEPYNVDDLEERLYKLMNTPYSK